VWRSFSSLCCHRVHFANSFADSCSVEATADETPCCCFGAAGSSRDEQFEQRIFNLVARPPAYTSTSLQELGNNAKKRPRIEIPLPPPLVGATWEHERWRYVADNTDLLEADDGPRQGLQSTLATLLQTAPTNTPFVLHDVHSQRSVCGDDLKPDMVLSLRGKPVVPITTGFILELKRQDTPYDTDQNVGKAITYGRTCLQQLPRSLRSKMLVGLTDLRTITIICVTLAEPDTFSFELSAKLPDVRHVLLKLLSSPAYYLHVEMPNLGPSVDIIDFLGRGATSNVYKATQSGQQVTTDMYTSC